MEKISNPFTVTRFTCHRQVRLPYSRVDCAVDTEGTTAHHGEGTNTSRSCRLGQILGSRICFGVRGPGHGGNSCVLRRHHPDDPTASVNLSDPSWEDHEHAAPSSTAASYDIAISKGSPGAVEGALEGSSPTATSHAGGKAGWFHPPIISARTAGRWCSSHLWTGLAYRLRRRPRS